MKNLSQERAAQLYLLSYDSGSEISCLIKSGFVSQRLTDEFALLVSRSHNEYDL